MSGKRAHCRVRAAIVAVLSFLLVFSLSGCRQTDFLKEVIMAAWADIVDEKAPIVVNNPDAEAPDEHLPAFDIRDVTTTTEEFQNIVVYASNPNTELVTTRHSVFDLNPRFTGVESSDAVRLVYGESDDDLDHEVVADEKREVEAESTTEGESEEAAEEESAYTGAEDAAPTEGDSTTTSSKKGSRDKANASSNPTGGVGEGEGSSDGQSQEGAGEAEGEGSGAGSDEGSGGTGGPDGGESGTGEMGDDGESEDETPDDGRSARDSGGYNGEDITYDPGNRLQLPQHSDHVAAIGQAAVIAQAVGGAGALVGMDDYTFNGLDGFGQKAAFASSFKDVFSDELPEKFASNALLWKRDGLVPGDVVSTEKLVAACADSDTGKGGTIVFCSDKGSQADYFSSKQLESFKAAEIQLVPISMSSPQGIIDAFVALGEVLSKSDEIDQDAEANAEQFRSIMNDLIKAATNSRSKSSDDGTFAVSREGSLEAFGDYYETDFATRFYDVWATVADGFEPSARYAGGVSLDTTDGLLFSTSDISADRSPLSLFMQASGIVHLKASDSSASQATQTTLLSPLSLALEKGDFKGYSTDGPMSRMGACGLMDAGHWSIGDNVATGADSAGSSIMPYLIVSSSSDMTGEQVKRRIIGQSDTDDSVYSLYEAGGSQRLMSDILSMRLPSSGGGTVELYSVLGCQHDYSKSVFLDKGVELGDCIRVNPNGLIGSWTQGTPEAVLECAWLVDLYSKYPEKSDYAGNVVNDMGKFKVRIGDVDCTTVQQAVEAFYKTVYRCDLGDLGIDYSKVVPDSGEGLSSVG